MRTFVAVPVLAVLGMAGCFSIGGVSGSGDVVTANRAVAGFSRIEASGTTSLTVQIGSPLSVSVEAQKNIADLIDTTVQGDTLTIHNRERYNTDRTAAVHVTVPSLRSLDMSGASSAHLGGFHGGDLEITISGAGDVHANGTVDNLELSCSGTGNAQLGDLAAQNARVELSGVGNARINAAKTIDVSISGIGSVNYIGGARITHQSISGLGHISHN